MNKFMDILLDILLILKLLPYFIYCLFEVLVRNLIPSTYLNKSVKGDIVLITGAAGGIGKFLVKDFLRLGSIVVCIDINETELSNLEKELNKEFSSGPDSIKNRMYFYRLDITSIEQVRIFANKIKKEVGKIDLLINNAGIMNQGKLFLDLTPEDILRIFNVNTLSQFWLCKEFLPDMIKENKGHIVNVSSVCGFAGGYKLTDYCSSKFAVLGFTESLRVELKTINPKTKINVSVVCPFHVRTKLFKGVDIQRIKWLNLTMEPEYVASEIVRGILLKKDIIMVPTIANHIFYVLKGIMPTKTCDYLQSCLDFNGSMDRYQKSD